MTLENKIANAKVELESLERALQRKKNKMPCPDNDSHILEIEHSVVGGGVKKDIKNMAGIDLKVPGYMLARCLACDAYILLNYDGSFAGRITKEVYRKLS